jgi:hypothetical protein
MKFQLLDLKNEAEQEVYRLIDERYRKLPKTKDGSIDFSASGFSTPGRFC